MSGYSRKEELEGVVKREQIQIECPACGQMVEAVVWDGRVKGYCAVAKQYVNFSLNTAKKKESRK